MHLLSLNTAGPACDIAVLVGAAIAVHRHEEMRRGQDARLPALVEEVLDEAGLTLQQLDRIAVVTGPGSFTGIRVGVAFARGLALTLGIPAVGVTSLEAGRPIGVVGEERAALPAQTRPPDRTFWVQRLVDGLGIEAVTEQPADHLDETQLAIAAPAADIAGLKATHLDPARRTPAPIYARAPDAALPKRRV